MPLIEDTIHPLIKSIIPDHLRDQESIFTSFMEEYYKWMESDGQVLFYARDLLETRDIDLTLDQFLVRFKEKYLVNFDFETAINKRVLIKFAKDLYRTKGTERGIELFFRLVYGETPEIYYPSTDLMRLSSGDWERPEYLELEFAPKILDIAQRTIIGFTSGATAFCSDIVKRRAGGKFIYIATIQDVIGTFIDGENITVDGIIEDTPKLKGSLTELTIIDGQQNFNLGEVLNVEGTGVGGIALVTNTAIRAGAIEATLIDGGYGFTSIPDNDISDLIIRVNEIDNIANDKFSSIQLHETITQPLVTVTIPRSNANFTVGDTVTSYYSNNTPIASGIIVFKAANNVANTTTIRVGVEGGDWQAATGNLYNNDNVFTYNTSGIVFSNATANVFTINTPNSSIFGIGDISGTFFPGALIDGNFSSVRGRVNQVFNNRKLTDLSYNIGPSDLGFGVELVTVNQNRIRDYLNVALDAEDFNFDIPSDIMSPIASSLTYETAQVGIISNITDQVTGNDYNFSTTINLDEPLIRNLYKQDYILSIDAPTGIFAIGEIVEQNINVETLSLVFKMQEPEERFIERETLVQNGSTISIINISNVDESAPVEFDANNDVDSVNDTFKINTAAGFDVGDLILYSIEEGASELGGLTNGDSYYVVFANTTDFAISTIKGGANIALTPGEDETHLFTLRTDFTFAANYEIISGNNIVVNPSKLLVGSRNGFEAEVLAIDSANSVSVAKGLVTEANSTIVHVARRSINVDFENGIITGANTLYTANVVGIDYNWNTPVAGNNAIINTDLINTRGILTSAQIISSGIGYSNNETVTLRSSTNTEVFATARTNNTKQGIRFGVYKDTNGFASADKYLLDSFYYQDYSYDIQSSIPVSRYSKSLEDVTHPAGMKYFGSVVRSVSAPVNLNTEIDNELEAEVFFTESTHTSGNGNIKATSGVFYVYNYSDTQLQANTEAMFGESDFSNSLFTVTMVDVEYANNTHTGDGNAYFTATNVSAWKQLDRSQEWYLRGSNTVIEVSANAPINVRFK